MLAQIFAEFAWQEAQGRSINSRFLWKAVGQAAQCSANMQSARKKHQRRGMPPLQSFFPEFWPIAGHLQSTRRKFAVSRVSGREIQYQQRGPTATRRASAIRVIFPGEEGLYKAAAVILVFVEDYYETPVRRDC